MPPREPLRHRDTHPRDGSRPALLLLQAISSLLMAHACFSTARGDWKGPRDSEGSATSLPASICPREVVRKHAGSPCTQPWGKWKGERGEAPAMESQAHLPSLLRLRHTRDSLTTTPNPVRSSGDAPSMKRRRNRGDTEPASSCSLRTQLFMVRRLA